MDPKLKLISN